MSEEFDVRLKKLARSGDRDALEEAWLESLENPGPAEGFLGALQVLDEQSIKEVSIALLPLVLETYDKMDRHPDALAIVRRLAMLQPDEPFTRRALLKHLEGTYKEEPWFEGFLRASGLGDRIPMDEGLAKFDSYTPYKPGCGVEHGAGWGVGVIEGFNEETWEVRVRFEDDFVRELPLASALDSLKPLADDHLGVMIMTRPDELKAIAEETPSIAIRKALDLFPRKTLNAARVKETLVNRVIPAKGWAKWWTRAKKEAAKDPYLQVEGGARPVFTLRDKPVSLHDEAVANVGNSADIGEAVKKVREYMAAKPDAELKKLLLEEISKRVESGMSANVAAGYLLDGILLLEEQGEEPPMTSESLLQNTLEAEEEDEIPAGTAELLESIPNDKNRLLSIPSLERAFPEHWADMLAHDYADLPKNLLDPVAEKLLKTKHGPLLVERYRSLMKAPWRDPWTVFFLSRRIASGGFAQIPDAPTISEVCLTMLRCLESSLFHATGTKQSRREVEKRYEELMFDAKRKVLDRFMEEASRHDCERAMEMIHLTSKLPDSIQSHMQSEIAFRFPDLVEMKEKPFWEEDYIYSTQRGIDKRNAELRDITEEKLPKIFKAIGKAADFGDLSENAEWTAALEEQRLLTEKASQIEEELGQVKAIENQRRSEGVVSPGTRVTLKRVEDGSEETYDILGPWDMDQPNTVSYKAPLAASLLGAEEGEQVLVELPGNSYEVQVLSVTIL